MSSLNAITSNSSINTETLSLRSYSKWAPTEQGATLVWRDLNVYAIQAGQNGRKVKSLKRIINNVTGVVRPGTLMALMGSSGAGKSTLMSVLSYRKALDFVVDGDILINGRKIGPFMNKLSGFVHQDDIFVGTLTVLEHLTFMIHLKLERHTCKIEMKQLIEDLLNCAGLKNAAHIKIGHDGDGKVLSGGEKKRLAFATELITNPAMLFCDEPTTGLDSYSAQHIIRTLQHLAQKGTAIICTIHQPSSELFAMFHQVLLLADGRTAFMGTPREAIDFFTMHGYKCPELYNPADFLIGILASYPGHEINSKRAAQRLCDLFAVSSIAEQRDIIVGLEIHMAESAEFEIVSTSNTKGIFWYTKMYWLTYRTILMVIRDPTIQVLRITQKMAIAIMAGLCFTGSINLSQTGVQAIQGAIFISISENTFTPMYSVLSTFPHAFPLFLRENRSGLYNTFQYYVANMIAMLPGLLFEPLIFMSIGYWLAGLKNTFYAFAMTTLAATMVMNVSTACGYFFSAAFNSVPLAMAYLIPFDYILMITSGVFVKLTSLPNYLSWMKYLSWLMYANEAISIIQWDGVNNITCSTNNSDLPCLRNGNEVLDHYSFSSDNLSRDLWVLGIIYLSFHILGFIFLWRKTKK